METKTSVLAVAASIVLLGCSSTPAIRDTPAGAMVDGRKSASRSAEEALIASYFVGKPAPFSSTTDLCVGAVCTVEIKVDAACNVSSIAVLNLGGVSPSTRRIYFQIIDSDPKYIFQPLGSNPPALVVNKSGSSDPAFGTPTMTSPYTMVVMFVPSPPSPRRSHEYGINIKNNSTGTMCPTYDPWVIE